MGDRTVTAAKNKIMKEDKLHRQGGGSGSQERNYEGEIMKGKNLEDKAVEAAKSEIMKEYKLGRQGWVGAAKGEIMQENKLGR